MFRMPVTTAPPALARPMAGPLDRWRRGAATWGISLVLHLLVLLTLGLVFFVDIGGAGGGGTGEGVFGQVDGDATGDLTSLVRVAGVGDPLSLTIDGEEEAILTVAEAPPPMLDSAAMRPPSLANRLKGGASPLDGNNGAGNEAAKGAAGEGQRLGDGKPSNVPISGRRGPLKLRLLVSEGGTPASEAAVDLGLAWLARHQRSDGSWSLDTAELCRGYPEPCPPVRAMVSDTGATGMALLAFLGAGHNHQDEGRYKSTVTRGLRWLMSHQTGDGNFYTGGTFNAHLYSQAIATMAICEDLALTGDPDLRKAAQKGLTFIVRAQNKGSGGWRYVPTIDADTSVFGWQMFALRSGQFAGFAAPKNTVRLSKVYLDDTATDRRRITYAYQPGRAPSPVMTAEALLCRQYLGWAKDNPAMVEGVSLVSGDLHNGEEGRNIYYWYYATQLMHNIGGPEWLAWNAKVRDGLIAEQVRTAGCDRGSWDPTYPSDDAWGARAGRVYQTSLSLLTLEVYYRFLPLYRTEQLELATKDDEPGKDADQGKPAPKSP